MMKKGEQGGGWRRLDNTAKLFPVITNQDLSNVFRISATLQEEIVPERLQQALEEVLPGFPAFAVKLRRGFFWYYFEWNRRKPYVEKEASYPCKYIDPHSNQLFLFRVSYYQKRINLEVFHAVTDGMGAITFLKALVCRYLQLLELKGAGQVSRELSEGRTRSQTLVEDSYLKHYKNIKQKKYSGQKAFRLNGKRLPLDGENIVHGYLDLGELKALCKAKGVSITKYLAAGLICSIYQVYWKPGEIKPITISIPVNLRAFFKSETLANFFAVTRVSFVPRDEKAGFDEILEAVSRQMDENISKEKMEETISYNVSSEKKWYVRIIPLVFKWAALNLLFRMKDGTYTMTLSNIGPVRAADETEELLLKQVERFHLILGVSKRQPVKCGVCADGDKVTVSFTSVFQDTALADAFFEHVRNDGISVDTESNGGSDGQWGNET
ncbi:MAG: hypothetical protein ACLTKI_03725 [Lachnospiraceae bacterium]